MNGLMASAICAQCGEAIGHEAPGGGLCATCLWQMLHNPDEKRARDMPGLPQVSGHEIIGELSRGGMGIVYHARQLDPPRDVALKMLLAVEATRPEQRERFRMEVRALAELDHPAILPLYQVGETGGLPWFTMKLAAGGSLASRLRRDRVSFRPEKAAALIARMAEAVHYAHARAVLHRDIKPGNILFDEHDNAFLADFGLAKLTDSGAEVTCTGTILGTPCYMAPEVAANGVRASTVASDVYGLGAVLYELLSGRPPFIVEGMAALVRKVVEDEPERPSTLAAHVPPDLELICLTCLAKDQRRRYSSAEALRGDLERWMRLWAWSRRHPALAGLSAALVLTIAGGGTWLALTNRQLTLALADARESRGRADAQSEFLIGEFADSLGKMGRLELIETACAKAAALDAPVDDAGLKRRARLLNRWAAVSWARGDGAGAVVRLRESRGAMESHAGRHPDDVEAFGLLLEAQCRLAEVLADTVSFNEANGLLDDAGERLRQNANVAPDEVLRHRSEIDRTRALIFTRLRAENEAALDPAARAVDSARNWHAGRPDDSVRTHALIRALRVRGQALMNLREKRLDDALPLFREGRALAESLCAHPNPEAAAEFELAQCTGWIGAVLRRQGPEHTAEALRCLKTDHEIMTRLTSRDATNWMWKFKLADADFALAKYYEANGDADLAAQHARDRTVRLEEIARQAPEVREWMSSYCGNQARAAADALARGAKNEARQLYDKALAGAMTILKRQPSSMSEQIDWSERIRLTAEEWHKANEPDEAARLYRDAISTAENEAAVAFADAWRWTAATLHRRLAELQNHRGDRRGALESNLAALSLRAGLLRSRAVRATDDPAAVANVCQKVAEAQMLEKLYDDALVTGAEALALFVECRDVSGSPKPWAGAVLSIVRDCSKAGGPHAAGAQQLAARALDGFFTDGPSGKTEQELADALRSFAAAPGTISGPP
jgi:tetratricopeptide (TPR) repeat protein